MRKRYVIGLLSMLVPGLVSQARAQSATEFTYQGELAQAGLPAQGLYDFQFRLFDASAAGNELGPVQCINDLEVIDGRFMIELDFGSEFESFGRFIEVSVRAGAIGDCNSSSGFVVLSPRQKITAVPQAGYAEVSGVSMFSDAANTLGGQPASFYTSATNLASGTLSDTRLSTNVPLRTSTSTQVFSGSINAPSFVGTGTGLTGLSATNIASGTINDARISTNIPRLNAANTFTGFVTANSGLRSNAGMSIFDTTSWLELFDNNPPFPGLNALRFSFSGSNRAKISATGSNMGLIIGTSSRPSALDLDVFGRLRIDNQLHIGTGDGTNDKLRVVGDGTIVRTVLESGGTDQIAELVFYENMSNTNGVILREDGRGSTNSLFVIDVTSGSETVMATFDRDNNSFSAPVKAFRIDHPLDPMHKELWHSCVESPDMLNIYSGIATTDANGYATIILPSYFSALNIEPRYQLTVIDDEDDPSRTEWVMAKVARSIGRDADDRFTIRTSTPGVRVSWQVTGVRNDPAARAFRIVPELEKAPEQQGKLLSPEAYQLIDSQREIDTSIVSRQSE